MLDRLRSLGKSFTVYGLGDVATSIISFLLLPIYARFLSPADYGAIGLLTTIELVTKIVYRFGLDASFMRLFVDCTDDQARQRLASTLFWFLFVVDGSVLVPCVLAAPLITHAIGVPGYEWALRILLLNTFVIGFYFIPFHVLRLTDRPATFVALTTSRSASTLLIRFALIIGINLGVTGFFLSDLIVSSLFTLVMLRWFRQMIRPVFSREVLREALRFGLPRVPHGLLQQAMFVVDRYAIRIFSALSEVGLYQMGASFGMALKLVLNAFEYAWAPFYFQTMKQPDAKETFRLVTTYGAAGLILLVAGLATVGPEVVRYVMPPAFHGAARIVPWIALGVGFHGIYLLTSIGLNITKSTRLYPLATGAAAATSLVANVLLVPRYGSLGAAWSNAAAYGVMASAAFALSQRVYPIPLEWSRLARIGIAGTIAFVAAWALPAMPPLAGALVRGSVVTVIYPACLAALGFLDARELRTLGRMLERVRAGRAGPAPAAAETDVTLADEQQNPMNRAWTPARLALLLALLALAEWLRATGLSFGLPAVYNPDEVAIMSRALGFARGDLNPHNFLYPTFYFYVLFTWVGGWFAYSWLTGAVSSLGAFQTQFFLDPSGVYHAGRMLGVACGVATVWLTWILGARVAGWRAGACAALLLAVAPTAVRDAHYVKHDVPATLAIVAAMVVLVRLARVGEAANAVVEPPSPLTLAGAGAACGVAFSTHYYAIFLVLPLALAVAARLGAFGRPRGSPRPSPAALAAACGWAGLGAAVTFFALSPFLLVEPRTAWQDIVANRQIVVDRAGALGGGPFPSAGAYLRLLWHEGLGWPGLGAAAIGLALVARRRPWQAMLLASFPLAFLVFLSHTVAASRYLNPALPFLAVFAGAGLALLARSTPLTAILVAMLALPAGWHSRQIGVFFREADTRTIAQTWIDAHVPPGSTILVQPYSVALTQSRESLVEALTATLGDPRRASTKFAIRLGLQPYPAPAYRTIYLGDGGLDADKIYVSPGAFVDGPGSSGTGLEPLTRLGVQYVVLKRYNTEDPAAVPLRARLMAVATRVAVVSPYRVEASDADRARVAPFLHNTDTPWHPALERPGPGLEIWKLPR